MLYIDNKYILIIIFKHSLTNKKTDIYLFLFFFKLNFMRKKSWVKIGGNDKLI